MSSSVLGPYWSPWHWRPEDIEYIRRLNPAWIRIHQPTAKAIHTAQENAPGARIVLRSWDIDDHNGDRKREMYQDPKGAARKHLELWKAKWDELVTEMHRNNWSADESRWYIGLANEPDPAYVPQVVEYTREAMQIVKGSSIRLGVVVPSVGNFMKPSEGDRGWTQVAPLEQPINDGGHILMIHEYWQPEGPRFGEDAGNLAWRHHAIPLNVPILIGEAGANGYIYNRHSEHDDAGWQKFMDAKTYAEQVREYIAGCDQRVQGVLLYMLDFHSDQWWSFDTRPAMEELLKIKDTKPQVPSPFAKKHTTHLPSVSSGPTPVQPPVKVPDLVHPVLDERYRTVTQGYGEGDYSHLAVDGVPLRGHTGIDFATPVDTPIRAVDAGTVAEVASDLGGYGLYIKLAHSWGESLYAHLDEQHVRVGETVRAGQWIGNSGNTGNSTGPHLHFALRVKPFNRQDGMGGFANPAPYLGVTVTPAPPVDMPQLIREAAAEFGVEWQLYASLVWAESSFRADAVSEAGAKGLAQLMPSTWAEWSEKVGGQDILNPSQNLRVGAAYLAWLLRQTQGNTYKALYAYSWGIGRVLAGEQPPGEVIQYAHKIVHGRDLLKAVV